MTTARRLAAELVDTFALVFAGCGVVMVESKTGVSASIRRVGYDTGAVAHEMRAVGLPEELAEKLVAAA